MIKIWKKQFKKEHFTLRHSDPHCFVRSQWQKSDEPSFIYMVYRWLLAFFFVIIMSLSIRSTIVLGEYDNAAKWLIYLTDWGIMLCTFQALLSAILVTVCIFNRMKDDYDEENKNTLHCKLYKFYWAVHTISFDLALLISIVYWSLLYDSSKGLTAENFLIHGANSILMFVDFMVVSHPVRLCHFYLPIGFSLTYLIFSVIYWAAGGTDGYGISYIYYILNWDEPGATVIYNIIIFIFYLFLHVFVFLVYCLRTYLHKKIVGDKYDNHNLQSGPQGNYPMNEVYVNEGINVKEIV